MLQTLKRYICLLLGSASLLFLNGAPAQAESVKEFYIKTVHIDGNANIKGDNNHPAEAFPNQGLPDGRGLQLTPPNTDGAWKIRAFTFEPSQITVRQGDNIRLNFIGVQGMRHGIHIYGQDIDKTVALKRGQMLSVDLKSVNEGIIEIECYDHLPVMTAQILVLP